MNVNPIINFVDDGSFVKWGEKTLSREQTNLDRVGCRRMLFYIEKTLKTFAKECDQEGCSRVEVRDFTAAYANGLLASIKARKGIDDWQVCMQHEGLGIRVNFHGNWIGVDLRILPKNVTFEVDKCVIVVPPAIS